MSYFAHHSCLLSSSIAEAGVVPLLTWLWILEHTDLNGTCHDVRPKRIASALAMVDPSLFTVDAVAAALELLQQPDPSSKRRENDGRRIVSHAEEGAAFVVTNFRYYNEEWAEERKRMKAAARQRRYEMRQKEAGNKAKSDVDDAESDASLTPPDAHLTQPDGDLTPFNRNLQTQSQTQAESSVSEKEKEIFHNARVREERREENDDPRPMTPARFDFMAEQVRQFDAKVGEEFAVSDPDAYAAEFHRVIGHTLEYWQSVVDWFDRHVAAEKVSA